MKKCMIPIIMAVSVSFLALGVLSAHHPDVLTLESKKGNITFPHQKHVDNGIKCTDCHHKIKSEDETPKPCRECHKKGEAVSAMKAFHSKKAANSCRGCHEKQGKGPKYTPCSNCHKK